MADLSANEELLDRAIRHAVFLERLKTQQVFNAMTQMNREVTPKLIKTLNEGFERGITKKIIKQVEREYAALVKKGFDSMAENLKRELEDISKNEYDFTVRMLKQSAPVITFTTAADIGLLKRIARGTEIRGDILDRWFKGLGEQTTSLVRRQINIGLAEGESIEQMVHRIKGTRNQNFNNGILQTSRRNVETIVRTSVQEVVNKTREQAFKENQDLIKGVVYRATLDARTTDICGALDSKVFNIGEGPRPPMHMQCRSTTTPVLKSWKELGIDLKEAPEGTRASMNGQVPAKLTYPEWLKGQPIEVQNQVLGKGKAQLFRRGKVSFDRFTDTRNRPLTLKQLQILEETLEAA